MIVVVGRIDSSNAHELGAALNAAIGEGRYQLVADLSGVDYMSSAGLRELMGALKQLRRVSGDLRLANPSSRVLDILDLAGLHTVLQIFPSQQEALKSF